MGSSGLHSPAVERLSPTLVYSHGCCLCRARGADLFPAFT